MNIKEQEYMLALDKTRSITRAAEFLHVTQPTLSIFLTSLEKRLGAPLFQRVGKRLVPTQVGEAYLRRAYQIAALKNDFDSELSDLLSGRKGKLHVGGLRMGNLFLMPRLLRQYQQEYPEIDVILHEDTAQNLERLLCLGELDLIYANLRPTAPGLISHEVRQDHMLAVISAQHPAAKRGRWLEGCHYPYLDLGQLEHEDFYLMEPGRTIRGETDAALKYAGVHPRKTHLITNIELGCQMAAEGLGIAFTMESYLQDRSYPRPVQYFRVGDPDHALTWYLSWREGAYVPAYMEYFITLLEKIA